MGQTAENGVSMCGIRRAEQDEFAVRSQNLAEQAIKNGFYSGEITPVELLDGVPSVFSTVISDASTSGSKVSSSSTASRTSFVLLIPCIPSVYMNRPVARPEHGARPGSPAVSP